MNEETKTYEQGVKEGYDKFTRERMKEIEKETIIRAEELKSIKEEYRGMLEKAWEWNPEKNEDVISIIKQKDGNWKGYQKKFGKLIEVRQIEPQIVLQMLLTSDGNV